MFWSKHNKEYIGDSIQSRFEGFGLTDVGKKRNNNEDVIFVSNSLGLYLVADGMGGHADGEVASALAVDVISAQFNQTNREITALSLKEAIREANLKIHQRSKEKFLPLSEGGTDAGGMGTTIVALAVAGEDALIAHVGDSRAYRMRSRLLERLTRDHSLAETAPPSANPLPLKVRVRFKNIIVRALGIDPTVDVEIRKEKIQQNDLFLLCSDGLNNMVSDQQTEEILASSQTPESACKTLIEEANLHGGADNISCILIWHR